ncbi:hypothetical protein T07_7524 [Trichinella nelsoni]|uniref:Uncharacterized protein n=1 Tax=Trichinella nelsoni TaxID=6336 RepID=A0A0V0SGC6_9BILA|nr:hypothetical protein T07_7524 [Trichinella nelsoni]
MQHKALRYLNEQINRICREEKNEVMLSISNNLLLIAIFLSYLTTSHLWLGELEITSTLCQMSRLIFHDVKRKELLLNIYFDKQTYVGFLKFLEMKSVTCTAARNSTICRFVRLCNKILTEADKKMFLTMDCLSYE